MRAVVLYSTSACNLRCKHCGVGRDQIHPRNQLSTEQIRVILSNLALSGTQYVTMLGGEVTLFRDDLDQLLDHAASIGIAISINTNLTVWDGIAGLLDKPALAGLIVSLDGANPATHDAMRGRGSFNKTYENAVRAAAHPRARDRALTIETAFVLSALNHKDAGAIVKLAHGIGSHRLSVKPVKMLGRAETFAPQLQMTGRDFLDAYSLMVLTWLQVSDLELDLFLPPAVAIYLNKRFGIALPVSDHPACGGVSEYGYVDLYGNHMPCPAMSFEENKSSQFMGPREEYNLLRTPVSAVQQTNLFDTFERRRINRTALGKMEPCRRCKFRGICSPCTADFILGKNDAEVGICAAVFAHGDEDVPGISTELATLA